MDFRRRITEDRFHSGIGKCDATMLVDTDEAIGERHRHLAEAVFSNAAQQATDLDLIKRRCNHLGNDHQMEK